MRNMLVLVLALGVSGSVFADDAPAGPVSEGGIRVQEGYIHPLLSRELHRVLVVRQESFGRASSGVFYNGWLSIRLENEPPTKPSGGEGHLELGWQGEICETATTVSTGVHVMGSDELFEQKLEWGVARLYTAAEESWDLRMRTAWVSTPNVSEGAIVLQPHVVHEWQGAFGLSSATLTQAFIASWDDGFEGYGIQNWSRGIFLRYEMSLAWKLGERTELVLPGFVGLFPLRAGHDGRGQRTEVSFGLRYAF